MSYISLEIKTHYNKFKRVIDMKVKCHDLTKLSEYEFSQYRRKFYPTKLEKQSVLRDVIDHQFQDAWKHHYTYNDHHWENWTQKLDYDPYEKGIDCAHMVIDWLAMSYEFGDTPRGYYEKNKDKIKLPDWAVSFIYEIFDRLEK